MLTLPLHKDFTSPFLYTHFTGEETEAKFRTVSKAYRTKV